MSRTAHQYLAHAEDLLNGGDATWATAYATVAIARYLETLTSRATNDTPPGDHNG